MQSDIIAHLNGLFGGKTRRKMVEDGHDVNKEHISIGAYLADKFRRKSESAIGVGELVNNKINSGNKTSGINLIRIAKLDFKLNLKRFSLHDDVPPQLPARHFSIDGDEDLPPPIPERKGSLEMILDEEFQGRFSFRPISTVPLPEPFSDIKKTYPSKTPRRNAFQRPPSQPPPPPPPPADDVSTTQPLAVTFDVASSQYDFDEDDLDDDFPPPPPPPSVSVTDDISVTPTDNRNTAPVLQVSTLPPPPARPPPPAPQTKKQNSLLSTFPSSPSLIPSTVLTSGSPKFTKNTTKPTRFKKPSPPALKSAKSEPNLVALHSAPGTTSPPLIPVRPPLLSGTKPQLTKDHHEIGVPPVVLPNTSQQHSNRSALKPSHQSAAAAVLKEKLTSGDNSFEQNGNAKNGDSKSSRQSSVDKTSNLPPLSSQKSPVPPHLEQPSPDTSQYPNRNRPLPSVPKPVLEKRILPVKKWAGPEVYDPREEDGDLYDVMDSTNM